MAGPFSLLLFSSLSFSLSLPSSLPSLLITYILTAGLYRGSSDPSDYPIVRGYNLSNIRVTGENTDVPGSDSVVDGVGWWWNCLMYESHGHLATNIPNPAAAPYCQIFNPTNQTVASVAGLARAPLRPKLLEFFNCTGVTIANITAQNAACWAVHPTYQEM